MQFYNVLDGDKTRSIRIDGKLVSTKAEKINGDQEQDERNNHFEKKRNGHENRKKWKRNISENDSIIFLAKIISFFIDFCGCWDGNVQINQIRHSIAVYFRLFLSARVQFVRWFHEHWVQFDVKFKWILYFAFVCCFQLPTDVPIKWFSSMRRKECFNLPTVLFATSLKTINYSNGIQSKQQNAAATNNLRT